MNDLRPYQIDGAAFLASRKHALLADEPGLGKTAQAIKALCVLPGDPVLLSRVLVVCPASVVENWKREIVKFGPGGPWPGIAVYSYEKVQKAILPAHLDVLIIDEAHYLKSATSKRTRAVLKELAPRADRVWLLTGTPMPNNPAELWPALSHLAPERILSTSGKPYSYWQFVAKFCKTVDNGFGLRIVGAKNHDDLKQRLDGFMLRRTKAEVAADMPPIAFENLYVEGRVAHTDDTRAAEWALAEALRDEGVEGLRSMSAHVATLRRLTGLAKVAACAEWISDFVEGGRQLVVFAHHREVIDGLKAALKHVPLAVVTGSTADRQREVDAFQGGGAQVFLGQIAAAGTGITLTAASDVLFVESSWVPADNSQAAMRVHRIGQSEPCLVRFATLAGSIDEDIQRAVTRKTADITRIVGGV